MIDLNELAIFAQVVERKGFAAAARALGLPKSTVSRKVSQLEERLGVSLLQRSTRRLSVTEIGQIYYRHCAAMLAEAESAQDAIDSVRAEPRGRLRITCPVSLMQSDMAGIASRFLAGHPRVTIDLEATNRRVDVIEEGVDVALRVRFPPLENTDLVMKRLAPSPQVIVVTPRLMTALGAPDEPEALASLPAMAFDRYAARYTWDLRHAEKGKRSVVFEPRYVTDDLAALRLAAEDGVGVVQLPLYMVREQLHAGTLVAALPGWEPASGIIHAVFSSRRGQSPALRAFIDFAAQAFENVDEDYCRRMTATLASK
jgi:DNA-binding transcriptional LysR family regulator